jgi:hypothetical protein
MRLSHRWRWFALVGCAAALGAILALRLPDVKPVRGVVSSSGAFLDTWSAAPDGCVLNPPDQMNPQNRTPSGEPVPSLSILWDDVTLHDPIRGTNWLIVPDAPVRLDLTRPPGSGDRPNMLLTTVKTVDPEEIDPLSCRELKLVTWAESPLVKGAQPTVGGTLDLDCTTPARHLTAHLKFDRCGL